MNPIDGRCACAALAYRLDGPPLFVHACHCTRCQRETGGPFAHHLIIETSRLQVLQGQPSSVQVPTDSGRRHDVVRCGDCGTVLWNTHGSRAPLIAYLRVGTLDEPAAWPPRAHIYVRSRVAWLAPDPSAPQFSAGYDARRTWPAESIARYEAAQAQRRVRGASGTGPGSSAAAR